MLQDLALVDRPGQRQALVRPLLELVLVERCQVVNADGQPSAEEIEHSLAGATSLIGGRRLQRRMGAYPDIGRHGELVERSILDLEQSALLQVG